MHPHAATLAAGAAHLTRLQRQLAALGLQTNAHGAAIIGLAVIATVLLTAYGLLRHLQSEMAKLRRQRSR
jgi:hypothetical protein